MLAAILLGLASAFLLASVGFGITRGEMRVESAEAQQFANRLNRAGNIAFGLFVAAELGLTGLIMRSALLSRIRLHWAIRFLGLMMVMVLCSFALVLIILARRSPRTIVDLERSLSELIMGAMR